MKQKENILEMNGLELLSEKELLSTEGGNANYDKATGIMCGAAVSGFFFGGAPGAFTGLAFGPGCGLMLGMRYFVQ